MKKRVSLKKVLVIFTIFLFLGLTLSPIFNADVVKENEFVEISHNKPGSIVSSGFDIFEESFEDDWVSDSTGDLSGWVWLIENIEDRNERFWSLH